MPGLPRIAAHVAGRQSDLATLFGLSALLPNLLLLPIYYANLTQFSFPATFEYPRLSGLGILYLAAGSQCHPSMQAAFNSPTLGMANPDFLVSNLEWIGIQEK